MNPRKIYGVSDNFLAETMSYPDHQPERTVKQYVGNDHIVTGPAEIRRYRIMEIIVRREEERDHRRTEEVAREAFWNLYVPGAAEHYLVHKIRSHPDFIKELAFVIEVEGVVEGGIFYTRSKIVTPAGEIPTISFGPVCISPKYHRRGLGRKLITHSIEKAKEMGYAAILILGYPYHYETYGFRGGRQYGISMPDGKYYTGLQVLPLREEALDGIQGYAVFSEGLEAEEAEIAAFDATFPEKEKQVLPCQREFEIACAKLDE